MEQKAILRVQETFQMVAPRADELTLIFYRTLFKLDPSVRSLFPEDMREQRAKLVQMLAFLVNGLSNPSDLGAPLKNLGSRHKAYQVKSNHFTTVGAALLAALEEILGPEFDEETKAAWAGVYGVISGIMQSA